MTFLNEQLDWEDDPEEEDDDFDWGDEEDQPQEEEEEDFEWEEEEEEEEFDWGDDDQEDQSFLPDEDEQGGDFLSGLLGGETEANYLNLTRDNKKARLDITKNSKEDHRYVQRYTKKELETQLKKDLKYFKDRCKSRLIIKPVLIMADYPYKKKSSDSDIPQGDKNVERDYVLVIGRLPKFKGTEQFKRKSYIKGHITYLPSGKYDQGELIRHFGLIIKTKKYKRIKKRTIRDLFRPLKNSLRNNWPFTIYKEFPRKIDQR